MRLIAETGAFVALIALAIGVSWAIVGLVVYGLTLAG